MKVFADAPPSADRSPQIGVRENGTGGYTDLHPLQPVTPAPYAMFAGVAGGPTWRLV